MARLSTFVLGGFLAVHCSTAGIFFPVALLTFCQKIARLFLEIIVETAPNVANHATRTCGRRVLRAKAPHRRCGTPLGQAHALVRYGTCTCESSRTRPGGPVSTRRANRVDSRQNDAAAAVEHKRPASTEIHEFPRRTRRFCSNTTLCPRKVRVALDLES